MNVNTIKLCDAFNTPRGWEGIQRDLDMFEQWCPAEPHTAQQIQVQSLAPSSQQPTLPIRAGGC